MGKLAELIKSSVSLGFYSPTEAERVEREINEAKSLRDQSVSGGQYQTGAGAIGVVRTEYGSNTARLFKKQNVRMLRSYAEYSIWVRAAIDIYRNAIEQAEQKLVACDEKKPVNHAIEREVSHLLEAPNDSNEPYSTIKGKMVEDFLVLGHGAVEKAIRRNLAPYQLFPMDAARLAFVQGWDGTDKKTPRYGVLDHGYAQVSRWLADPMAMVLTNRPRSYDSLGLSHVESLDLTVRALLEGDDYFLKQSANPAPGGALDLGNGVTQPQVDELRSQIESVRRPFIVMGGTEGAQFIRFNATEREMRLLDQQVWFVRQVAAIFQVSTAALRLAVDTSRANTEAMFENDQEGPGAMLWRIREAENQALVLPFGTYAENNLRLEYPVMGRKDEKRQAEVTKIQTGGSPWVTTNEARRQAGKEPLKLKVADEVLVPTKGGVIPLSAVEEQFFGADNDKQHDL